MCRTGHLGCRLVGSSNAGFMRAAASKTRSELRVLAYPKLGYRQRLTTWKKNGRYMTPARVRGANQ